jgi:hypothetical protein
MRDKMIRFVSLFILTSVISLTLILSGFSQNNIIPAGIMPNKITDADPLSKPSPKGGNSCISCHENLNDKKQNKPVIAWSSSIHNKNGNNCNICHGGNPDSKDAKTAKSKEFNFVGKPDKKNITEFCGRAGCHSEEVSNFKRGSHFSEVLKTNKPNCTHCHGVHNIKQASTRYINMDVCSDCHTADHSRKVVSDMNTIKQNIDEVDNNINILKKKHANVDALAARLAKTRMLYKQMIHVSSKNEMKSVKTIIDIEIKNLEVESKGLFFTLKRLDLLYMLMVLIAAVIIITVSSYIIYMLSRRKKIIKK